MLRQSKYCLLVLVKFISLLMISAIHTLETPEFTCKPGSDSLNES